MIVGTILGLAAGIIVSGGLSRLPVGVEALATTAAPLPGHFTWLVFAHAVGAFIGSVVAVATAGSSRPGLPTRVSVITLACGLLHLHTHGLAHAWVMISFALIALPIAQAARRTVLAALGKTSDAAAGSI